MIFLFAHFNLFNHLLAALTVRTSRGRHHGPLLTSDDELALMLHGGGLVAGDAGVVAVVVGRQVVDAQRAGEVDVVHRHAQTDRDRPAVLLPRDVQRPVTRHDHAGDEDALADGEALELEGLDVGRNCGREGGAERSEVKNCWKSKRREVRVSRNILYFVEARRSRNAKRERNDLEVTLLGCSRRGTYVQY